MRQAESFLYYAGTQQIQSEYMRKKQQLCWLLEEFARNTAEILHHIASYCIYITCNINIYHIHFAYIVKKVLSQNDLRHLPCRVGSLLLNLYPQLPAKTVRSITPACANCFIALDTVGMEIWQAMAISFSCSKSLCTISP